MTQRSPSTTARVALFSVFMAMASGAASPAMAFTGPPGGATDGGATVPVAPGCDPELAKVAQDAAENGFKVESEKGAGFFEDMDSVVDLSCLDRLLQGSFNIMPSAPGLDDLLNQAQSQICNYAQSEWSSIVGTIDNRLSESLMTRGIDLPGGLHLDGIGVRTDVSGNGGGGFGINVNGDVGGTRINEGTQWNGLSPAERSQTISNIFGSSAQ